MTPRRVLLMAHPSRPEALEVAMGVADKLAQAGIEVRLPAGELGESVLGQHPVVVVHDGDDPAVGVELVVVLGGEQVPNAALMERSTVPVGVAAEAHRYLAEGGPANLAQLHAFLSDTVLLTGEGFEPPSVAPDWGVLDRESRGEGPTVALLMILAALWYRDDTRRARARGLRRGRS